MPVQSLVFGLLVVNKKKVIKTVAQELRVDGSSTAEYMGYKLQTSQSGGICTVRSLINSMVC